MASPLPFIPFPAATGGVRTDVAQSDIGPNMLWRSENWLIRDGLFRTRLGLARLGSIQEDRIQGLYEHETATGEISIVYATLKKMFAYFGDGDPDVDLNITLTGEETDLAVFRTFIKSETNYLLMTNGKDPLQKWDGDSSNNAEDAAGSPPVMRGMMILNNRLLALGLVGDHENAVDCSDLYDFEAGWGNNRVILADSPGGIRGGLEMGNLQGAIYMAHGIYIAQALGGAEPFSYRLAWPMPNAGCVSAGAMCALPSGEHAFVGQDGNVYIFDGVQARPVGRHVQKFLLESCDMNKAGLISIGFDAEQRDLWVLYPEKGRAENNMAVAIKLPDGTLWPQRMRSTARGACATAVIKARIPTSLTIGDLTGPIGELEGTIADFDSRRSELVFGTIAGSQFNTIQSFDEDFWSAGTGISGLAAAKVNDGEIGSTAFTTGSALGYLKFDFGASGCPKFRGLRIWGDPRCYPSILISVEYSDDDVAYTPVTQLTIADLDEGGESLSETWADPGEHQYWRVAIAPGPELEVQPWHEIEWLMEADPAMLQVMNVETDADAFFETALLPGGSSLNMATIQQVEHFFDAPAGRTAQVSLGSSNYGFERKFAGEEDPDEVTVADEEGSISEHSLTARYFSLFIQVPGTPANRRRMIWRGSAADVAERGKV